MPDLSQTPDEQIVTMTIPVDEPQEHDVIMPVGDPIKCTCSIGQNHYQTGEKAVDPIKPDNPHEIIGIENHLDGTTTVNHYGTIQLDKIEDIPHEHIPETQPDGRIKCVNCGKYGFMQPIDPENNKEEEPQKHEGGRPCSYCESKDKLQTIANDYIFAAITETDEKKKIKIPFTEELALKLSIHRETLLNWTNESNPHCMANHVEFIDTIKTLKTIQAFRLQQRTLGRYNPTGAIFLLKANHNFMESEKKILAGDRTEPLTIEIIEEDK